MAYISPWMDSPFYYRPRIPVEALISNASQEQAAPQQASPLRSPFLQALLINKARSSLGQAGGAALGLGSLGATTAPIAPSLAGIAGPSTVLPSLSPMLPSLGGEASTSATAATGGAGLGLGLATLAAPFIIGGIGKGIIGHFRNSPERPYIPEEGFDSKIIGKQFKGFGEASNEKKKAFLDKAYATNMYRAPGEGKVQDGKLVSNPERMGEEFISLRLSPDEKQNLQDYVVRSGYSKYANPYAVLPLEDIIKNATISPRDKEKRLAFNQELASILQG